MDVILFNTLTGADQKVVPIHDHEVRMYHCGPTVYDYAHIGNLRAFVVNDILRRTIEYAGYRVNQMMNITDIDDKTIKKSKSGGIPLAELTRHYEVLLLADFRHLNIELPEHIPRATEHIGGMIALIEKLLSEGYAYASDDGIYFDISKSKGYGALARLDLSAITQSRIASDEYDKKNARDFALWKFWTTEDGENAYEASFGRGRPGWHIECSAMAMSELGETLDIHTGGVDLIFPHHTNEIAQSEAVTGRNLSNIWLHNEFVMINGQKMSKSLDNIVTLKTVTKRGFSPLALRYWVLGAHYRTKANFTWEALLGSETALRKLNDHIGDELGSVNEAYRARFAELITNDLNTPRALAIAWEVAKDPILSQSDKTATLLDFDRVFGLGLAPRSTEEIPAEITALVRVREQARLDNDWVKSDEIRAKVKSLGWDISDTSEGQKISKLQSSGF